MCPALTNAPDHFFRFMVIRVPVNGMLSTVVGPLTRIAAVLAEIALVLLRVMTRVRVTCEHSIMQINVN